MRLRFVFAAVIVAAIAVPAAQAAKPVKPGQQPTLTAAPNVVVLGGSTVLSGRLKGGSNSGQTVTLQGAPG